MIKWASPVDVAVPSGQIRKSTEAPPVLRYAKLKKKKSVSSFHHRALCGAVNMITREASCRNINTRYTKSVSLTRTWRAVTIDRPSGFPARQCPLTTLPETKQRTSVTRKGTGGYKYAYHRLKMYTVSSEAVLNPVYKHTANSVHSA